MRDQGDWSNSTIGSADLASCPHDNGCRYDYSIKKEFESLLKQHGKVLDPVGHEAWMPKETEYVEFFIGKWVKAYLAKVEYVMISKAAKAPEKNKALIADYLASAPPDQFFKLAEKYKVDLDSVLE